MAQTAFLPHSKEASGSTRFASLRESSFSSTHITFLFVYGLMRSIASFRFGDGNDLNVGKAVREALENTTVYGNELNPQNRIYLTFRLVIGSFYKLRDSDSPF